MTVPGWIDEIAWPADGPPWLAMGLARIQEAAWLLPDGHRDAELAQRGALLDQSPGEVFAALPGTEAASAEVLAMVRSWEHDHGPDLAGRPIDRSQHPLEAAGRRTQEDLVLMVPHADGHHLDAAVLCFPSHWRLADKVGGSATAIHAPVPGYEVELAEKVDRFLDRLRPGVIVARRNWSVHGDAELHAPVPPADPVPVAVDEVARSLWLRSERQTLRRLPDSGAVLFTIRVQQAPFAAFAAFPEAAVRLADRLDAQPDELTAMNGLAPHRGAAVDWLRRVAETPSAQGSASP
ncbi:heme-dependent oxidative N-demethylase family protein [Aquihabitans daechungensis]|uniref:heme-dependent oxidative N-demethylase family protein n=1 Tax=Aquihabitans daechungensis TaxID=1052257 RepID=UPI003B9F200C